ncbi:MAG: hypothetical protein WBD53_04540, partial [Xanthobacteraceae bacterium]
TDQSINYCGVVIGESPYPAYNGEVVHSGSASELAKDEERVRALAGVGGNKSELPTDKPGVAAPSR